MRPGPHFAVEKAILSATASGNAALPDSESERHMLPAFPSILQRRIAEYLRHDASWLHVPVAYAALAAGSGLWRFGTADRALNVWTATHSAGFSSAANAAIARRLRLELDHWRIDSRLIEVLRRYPDRYGTEGSIRPSLQDPMRMLGTRILVLKSPRPKERGVLVLGYSYVFPLFARLFNVPAIAERYHIVLEPSWVGYCTLDILHYASYDFPVFVESWEPVDTQFITSLETNLVPVPVADNWWVDHRVVSPDPTVTKDTDVVMVAAWAAFKRHWRFFDALQRLRRRGHRPRVLLVGYPVDLTAQQIADDARRFGVADQLEFHESVPMEQVVHLLNRSRIHLLWSRREGGNRAHVEAMFAGLPVILRDGFNYGHRHTHVNPQTGTYATEQSLPDKLMELISTHDQYSPREWAMRHLTCQRATRILGEVIREAALAMGEEWTEDLAVKTVRLNRPHYWNPDDQSRFRQDYAFLERHIRR